MSMNNKRTEMMMRDRMIMMQMSRWMDSLLLGG